MIEGMELPQHEPCTIVSICHTTGPVLDGMTKEGKNAFRIASEKSAR
jgi:hypothetical protein